jgi:hypothetical protein
MDLVGKSEETNTVEGSIWRRKLEMLKIKELALVSLVALGSSLLIATPSQAYSGEDYLVCHLDQADRDTVPLRECGQKSCKEILVLGPDMMLNSLEPEAIDGYRQVVVEGYAQDDTDKGMVGWAQQKYLCEAPMPMDEPEPFVTLEAPWTFESLNVGVKYRFANAEVAQGGFRLTLSCNMRLDPVTNIVAAEPDRGMSIYNSGQKLPNVPSGEGAKLEFHLTFELPDGSVRNSQLPAVYLAGFADWTASPISPELIENFAQAERVVFRNPEQQTVLVIYNQDADKALALYQNVCKID